MINYKTLGGFDYEKEPYDEFVESLENVPGVTMHDLGESTYSGKHVYGASLGDLNKPTIIISNLHGTNEWRAPYYIKGFLEHVARAEHPMYKEFFIKLKTQYSIFSIPILNPYGYEFNTRTNGNNVDLNRNFDNGWEDYEEGSEHDGEKGSAPFSEPESQILRDIILEHKPILFVDCHIWGGGARPTYEPASIEYDVLFDDTIKSFNFAGMVAEPFRKVPYDNFRPKAAAWVSYQKNHLGKPIISTAIEAGQLIPDYDKVKEGMDMLMLLCMNAVNQYENNGMVIT